LDQSSPSTSCRSGKSHPSKPRPWSRAHSGSGDEAFVRPAWRLAATRTPPNWRLAKKARPVRSRGFFAVRRLGASIGEISLIELTNVDHFPDYLRCAGKPLRAGSYATDSVTAWIHRLTCVGERGGAELTDSCAVSLRRARRGRPSRRWPIADSRLSWRQ
jgi:hypothetical protein